MPCPRCQHENGETARFCEECGTKLARACLACGQEVNPTAKFCPACGVPLARQSGVRSPESEVRQSLESKPILYTPPHLVERILAEQAAMEARGAKDGDESARIGQTLLAEEARLFHLWYRVRDGTLSEANFQVAMLPVMARVGALVREGTERAEKQTQRTCRNLLKLEAALRTFVWEADVEPSNNSAERPLRRAGLWRRRSFGTQSAAGSQFVERILTAVTTLRQQHRDVLEYLTAACTAAIRGEQAPSLLASAPPAPSAS